MSFKAKARRHRRLPPTVVQQNVLAGFPDDVRAWLHIAGKRISVKRGMQDFSWIFRLTYVFGGTEYCVDTAVMVPPADLETMQFIYQAMRERMSKTLAEVIMAVQDGL